MTSASSAVNVTKYDPVNVNDQSAAADAGSQRQPAVAVHPSHQTGERPKQNSSCCGCPMRYSVTSMISIGLLLYFSMRCNISSALLELAQVDIPMAVETESGFAEQPFNSTFRSSKSETSPTRLGLIDNAVNWGCLLGYIPGGYLAARFPAQKLFGGALAASGIFNLIIPVASQYHFLIVIALRVLQGVTEGIALPASYGMLRHWAPPSERSRMVAIILFGAYGGVITGLAYGSILTENFGWREQFYTFGSYLLLWWLCWLKFSESPASNKSISEQEKLYIQSSINAQSAAFHKPPWKKIFSSKPMWAVILVSFANAWSNYVIIGMKHLFFKDMLVNQPEDLNIEFFLPQLALVGAVLLGGILADFLLWSKLMSTTLVRRTFTCCGLVVKAICLVVLVFVPISVGRILLLVAAAFGGIAASGLEVNYLDIAPRYASILVGISGTLAIFARVAGGILSSVFTIYGVLHSWIFVLLVAACVHLVSIIFYAIFASGDKQSWAEPLENGEDSTPRQMASDDQAAIAVSV